MGRFVFLDRDGTLVHDTGYPHRPEDYRLLPGVIPGLEKLVAAGFELAIVTNQSGIGRGRFDESAFERFQGLLLDELGGAGIVVARSYHCPHRPDAGCVCRKPAPGMLLRARDELGATLEASWMIGDGAGDMEVARRAGCRGAVQIIEGVSPDATSMPSRAPDLEAAATIVLAAEAESPPRA